MPAGAALGAVPHCAACERQPLTHVAGSCAVGRYEGPLRQLILSLKFGHGLAAAPLLGRLLARRVRQTFLDEERVGPLAVVAVPLARDVRRARGFNQSEELASFLAAELGWTASFRLLRKVRSTPPQALQTLEGRRVNLEGAFSVTARRVSSLARQGVLLVDDVVTTGATAWTCAQALRAAGTGPVWVAAVARTC
jgi:ComF family protein